MLTVVPLSPSLHLNGIDTTYVIVFHTLVREKNIGFHDITIRRDLS